MKPIATGVLACLLASTFASHTAESAERRGRLTIDIKVTGQENWRGLSGRDQAKVSINQQVSIVTFVQTDGEIVNFNSKDPDYYQQMMKGQTSNGSYLQYFGFPECGAKIRVTVNDVAEGAFADVNGPVPFSNKTEANYTGDANEQLILCSQTNVVLDTKQNVMYTDGLLLRGAKGTSTRTQRGQTTQSKSEVPLKGEAFNWASEKLRKAPRTGIAKTTIKLTQPVGSSVPFAAKVDGSADVEMTWRFEDV